MPLVSARPSPRSCIRIRSSLVAALHTGTQQPSSKYLDSTQAHHLSVSSSPDDLPPSQRSTLNAALRVDQAGEVAANYIYQGQLAVLRRDRRTAALIQVCPAANAFEDRAHSTRCCYGLVHGSIRTCGSKKRNIWL